MRRLLTLALLVSACDGLTPGPAKPADVGAGNPGGADVAADVGADPDAAPVCGLALGQPCYVDEQCDSGICLIAEVAPFGVCTVACATAPGPCETGPGAYVDGAWCVQYPEDDFRWFNHPELVRFCLPTCQELSDCQSIDPAWEVCDDVLYKGDPLFPSDPKNVCQAPSATGKEPVDPFTCEGWDVKNTIDGSDKLLCTDYCQFLDQCQIYEPGHNLDCCAWYCINRLTGTAFTKGEREAYKDEVTNYVLAFKSAPGTAIQCTQPVADFGPPAKPDANAPKPVAGKCR